VVVQRSADRAAAQGDAALGRVEASASAGLTALLRRPEVALGLIFAFFVPVAAAAPSSQPSERGCLIAWNTPSNHVNRTKLIAARPVSGLSLRGGTSFTDTVTATKKVSTSTSTEACLLTVAKAGTIQIVTGKWGFGRVRRWSWGRAIPTAYVFIPNVRLLSDGRVTKIYGH
jgi:hypothetical protein